MGEIPKKNREGEFYPKEEDKLGGRGTSRFTHGYVGKWPSPSESIKNIDNMLLSFLLISIFKFLLLNKNKQVIAQKVK